MEKPTVTMTIYADHPDRVAALYALMGVQMGRDEAGCWSAGVEARLEIRRGEGNRKAQSTLRLRIAG